MHLPACNGRHEIDLERQCVVTHAPLVRPSGWQIKFTWFGRQSTPFGLHAEIRLHYGRTIHAPSGNCIDIPLRAALDSCEDVCPPWLECGDDGRESRDEDEKVEIEETRNE